MKTSKEIVLALIEKINSFPQVCGAEGPSKVEIYFARTPMEFMVRNDHKTKSFVIHDFSDLGVSQAEMEEMFCAEVLISLVTTPFSIRGQSEDRTITAKQ